MKIIDLLNMIANMENKEDVPREIKCRDEIWKFDQIVQDYMNVDNGDFLFTSAFIGEAKIGLNQKVEIIEEKKEIEEIIINNGTLKFPNGGGQWTARNMDKAFAIKINELIDEVNKLKEND